MFGKWHCVTTLAVLNHWSGFGVVAGAREWCRVSNLHDIPGYQGPVCPQILVEKKITTHSCAHWVGSKTLFDIPNVILEKSYHIIRHECFSPSPAVAFTCNFDGILLISVAIAIVSGCCHPLLPTIKYYVKCRLTLPGVVVILDYAADVVMLLLWCLRSLVRPTLVFQRPDGVFCVALFWYPSEPSRNSYIASLLGTAK